MNDRPLKSLLTKGEKRLVVAELKAWAGTEGTPVTAFQALKVPGYVLKEAGSFVSAGGPGRSLPSCGVGTSGRYGTELREQARRRRASRCCSR